MSPSFSTLGAVVYYRVSRKPEFEMYIYVTRLEVIWEFRSSQNTIVYLSQHWCRFQRHYDVPFHRTGKRTI